LGLRTFLLGEVPWVWWLVVLPSARVLYFLHRPGCQDGSPRRRPLHGGDATVQVLSPFPHGPADNTIAILMQLFQHPLVDLLALSRRLIRTVAFGLLLCGSLCVELIRAIAFVFLLPWRLWVAPSSIGGPPLAAQRKPAPLHSQRPGELAPHRLAEPPPDPSQLGHRLQVQVPKVKAAPDVVLEGLPDLAGEAPERPKHVRPINPTELQEL